jgi:hypothetical protein
MQKLDPTLLHAVEQHSAEPIRTLIRVQPGATDRVVSHLQQHGLTPTHMIASDLLAVQLPVSLVRSIAADPDVVQLSSDANVSGL